VSSPVRGHRSVAHTADVILEAWGPDLAACAEEAVAALVATYASVSDTAVVARSPVRLSASNPDTLLLGVLDEVIFALDTEVDVPVGAELVRNPNGGWDLVLLLAGRAQVEPRGSVPKAVSLSGLDVTTGPDGVRCRFLVDV
jgi:SHS2 domain-containing protein